MTVDSEYDVALSFAGEDRAYVEQVAQTLRTAGIRVFYDDFQQVNLWGKDLYVHLQEVYQHKAKYTVMFVSKHYSEKRWPNHERQSAQARAFEENREYILPARFDDTPIPGLAPTTGYLDLRAKQPAELAAIVVEKLRGFDSSADRWSSPKHVFIMHAAKTGSPNLKYTVTKRLNTRELLRALPKDSTEYEYFYSDTALQKQFPDGEFNVWGVPRGARPSFARTEIGDLVLFVGQLSDDAAIEQLGIVKVKCPIECPIASRILWPAAPPDKSYPLLFFFDTEIGSRQWIDFTADIKDSGYNPRGWYKQIADKQFEAFGGPAGYLRYLRQVGRFTLMKEE
jgi:hypothetical protein